MKGKKNAKKKKILSKLSFGCIFQHLLRASEIVNSSQPFNNPLPIPLPLHTWQMSFTNSYLQSRIDYIFDALVSGALLLLGERLPLPTNQQRWAESNWKAERLQVLMTSYRITPEVSLSRLFNYMTKYIYFWLKGISICFFVWDTFNRKGPGRHKWVILS